MPDGALQLIPTSPIGEDGLEVRFCAEYASDGDILVGNDRAPRYNFLGERGNESIDAKIALETADFSDGLKALIKAIQTCNPSSASQQNVDAAEPQQNHQDGWACSTPMQQQEGEHRPST